MKRGIITGIAVALSAAGQDTAPPPPHRLNPEQLPTIIQNNLTPQKLELLQATDDLRQALEKAIAALQGIHDSASADAVIPVLRILKETQEHYGQVCRKVVPTPEATEKYYADGTLHYALRQLPVAAYNRLLQQEIAAACHGSVKLFLFITGQESVYGEEELCTPMPPTDAATLQMVETEILNKLPQIKPAEAEAFLAALEQSEAAVRQLKNNVQSNMRFYALIQAKREAINEFYKQSFSCCGPVIERIMIHRNTWMSDLYSPEARDMFFHRYELTARDETSLNRCKQLWQQAAPRIYAYCKRNHIAAENGQTPHSAISFPVGTTHATYPETAEKLVKEFFGDAHVLPGLHSYRYKQIVSPIYGIVVRIPVYVGQSDLCDETHYHELILTNLYIKLPPR